MISDKVLYVNWIDGESNIYKLGILARIDGIYYLKTSNIKNVTIAGFENGKLYKSKRELFDFFKERVYVKGKDSDVMEELIKTKGITYRDGYYVEEAEEEKVDKIKQLILELDKSNKDLQKS